MLVPGANITGIAKRLAKDGFIIKKSDPRDDRVTILKITPKGKKALQKIATQKDQRLKLMLKNLSAGQKRNLIDQVKSIFKKSTSI
jgi:DNA-binding MarR family transcriptional regulator